MTADHVRPLLESARDTHAKGRVPIQVGHILRMGRMTALRKDGGGVRGIVAGEVIRRFTAKNDCTTIGIGRERGYCTLSICPLNPRMMACGVFSLGRTLAISASFFAMTTGATDATVKALSLQGPRS